MTLNEIHDEVATLLAMVREETDLYPTTEFGLGAVPGSLYVSEDYILSIDPNQANTLTRRYLIDPATILRIGGYTIFSLEDPTILRATLTLESNHD